MVSPSPGVATVPTVHGMPRTPTSEASFMAVRLNATAVATERTVATSLCTFSELQSPSTSPEAAATGQALSSAVGRQSNSGNGQAPGAGSRDAPASDPARGPAGTGAGGAPQNGPSNNGQLLTAPNGPNQKPDGQSNGQPGGQLTGQPGGQLTGQPGEQSRGGPAGQPKGGQPSSSPSGSNQRLDGQPNGGQPKAPPNRPDQGTGGQQNNGQSFPSPNKANQQPAAQPTGQPGQPNGQPAGQPKNGQPSPSLNEANQQPQGQPKGQPAGQPKNEPANASPSEPAPISSKKPVNASPQESAVAKPEESAERRPNEPANTSSKESPSGQPNPTGSSPVTAPVDVDDEMARPSTSAATKTPSIVPANTPASSSSDEGKTPPSSKNGPQAVPSTTQRVSPSPPADVPAATLTRSEEKTSSPPANTAVTEPIAVEDVSLSSSSNTFLPGTMPVAAEVSPSLPGNSSTTPTVSASSTPARVETPTAEQTRPTVVTTSTSPSVLTSSRTSKQAPPQESAKSPEPNKLPTPEPAVSSPTESSTSFTEEPPALPAPTAISGSTAPPLTTLEPPSQSPSQTSSIESTQTFTVTTPQSFVSAPTSDLPPALPPSSSPTQSTGTTSIPRPPQNPGVAPGNTLTSTQSIIVPLETPQSTTGAPAIGSTVDGTQPTTTTIIPSPSNPFGSNRPQDNNNPSGDKPGGTGNRGDSGSGIVPPIDSSSSSSGGLSTRSIIGISVGGFAALALITLLVWAWQRRATRKLMRRHDAQIADQLHRMTGEKAVGGSTTAGGWGSGWAPLHHGTPEPHMSSGPSHYIEAHTTPQGSQHSSRRTILGMLAARNFGADWWWSRPEPAHDSGMQGPAGQGNQGPMMSNRPLDVGANLHLSLQGAGTFDPFSDAQAASNLAYMPRPGDTGLLANPFADSAAVLGPSVHRRSKSRKGSITYAPTIPPHTRGRSLNATTGGLQETHTQLASRAHSLQRESLQSSGTFSERRNKFRSDPFDLELQNSFAPPGAAIAEMPGNPAASSTYSTHTHTHHVSPSSSRYTSGVSASSYSDAGVIGAVPGRRGADSPTLAEIPPPPPRARTRPQGGSNAVVPLPGMSVGQAL